MTKFKKLKSHGFTRYDILKDIPLSRIIKLTIVPIAIYIIWFFGIFLFLKRLIEDTQFVGFKLEFTSLILYIGLGFICFLAVALPAMIMYDTRNTNLKHSFFALLDFLLLDICEVDTVVLGSKLWYHPVREDLKLKNSNAFQIGNIGNLIAFAKKTNYFFDNELSSVGYTIDELRHNLVHIHCYCLRRTLIPIRYISFSLSNHDRTHLHTSVKRNVKNIEGKDGLPRKTKKLLKKEYHFIIWTWKKLERKIESNPEPFLEVFKDSISHIGIVHRYDPKKKIISKHNLSTTEIAKILFYELYAIDSSIPKSRYGAPQRF